MPLPIAIAAATAAIGGIVAAISEAVAAGQEAEAQKIYKEALAKYGDLIKPKLDQAVAQEVPDTAFLAITEDPELRGTQLDALGQLKDVVNSAGMTSADEAMLQLANQGAQQQAGSDYQSMQQQLAARGQSGNPALMAASMGKMNQNVVNATATNRYRAMADAQMRRLRAIESMGGLAGGIRKDDYGISADRATALDRTAAFNADKRTGADAANRQGAEQMFANDVTQLDRETGVREDLVDDVRRRANNTRRAGAAVSGAISSGGEALYKGVK